VIGSGRTGAGSPAGERRPTATHTIIYSRGGGRTCDQLLTLAQFVAFAHEFAGEFSIVDIPFWPFGSGFAAFESDRVCAVPTLPPLKPISLVLRAWDRITRLSGGKMLLDRPRAAVHWRLSRSLEKAAARRASLGFWIGDTRTEPWEQAAHRRRDFLYLDEPEVLADLRHHGLTVVCGPKIRCWRLVAGHEEVVRRTLRIREDVTRKAEAHVRRLRTSYDFLIGVMVRQSDYREYAGGRFFFESGQYAAWMREALALFGDRGRVGFLIASEEPQDPAVFRGLPAHFGTGFAVGPGHYLENLAELGCCDLVMTTASSFGCWGAFIGRAPVLPLVRPDQPLRARDTLANLWDCTQHPDLKVAIW
jgi:hypothetical protein